MYIVKSEVIGMSDTFGEWSDFGAWSALNARDTIDLSDREIYEQLEQLMTKSSLKTRLVSLMVKPPLVKNNF